MSSTQPEHRAFWIIGAGLAGALLTCLLAKRGIAITVSERRSSVELEQLAAGRSINLALAERGRAALAMVGEVDTEFGPRLLLDEVMHQAIRMPGRAVHLADGSESFQPYAADQQKCIWSVHRARLNRTLLSAAKRSGATLQFDERVLELDLASRRALVERAGQRFEVHFDVVIGADGAGSAVRDAIVQASAAEYHFDNLQHGYKELSIPPIKRPGCDELAFALNPNALHIWPRGGFMLIALPNPDLSFTATLFLQNEGPESFAALQSADAIEAFFKRHFAHAIARMPNYLQDMQQNPLGRLATLRAPRWHFADRALVLGDAAHAIVPFHGQGMNCAFEDCVALAKLLEQRAPDASLEAVFAQFVAERQPQAHAIAEMAIENYLEMRDLVADPHFRLMKAVEQTLALRHPQLFTPRYELVSFSQTPYAQARAIGALHKQLLTQLCDGKSALDQIDWDYAAEWIQQHLTKAPAIAFAG
jgi:kynurenine 3-monooxygenase